MHDFNVSFGILLPLLLEDGWFLLCIHCHNCMGWNVQFLIMISLFYCFSRGENILRYLSRFSLTFSKDGWKNRRRCLLLTTSTVDLAERWMPSSGSLWLRKNRHWKRCPQPSRSLIEFNHPSQDIHTVLSSEDFRFENFNAGLCEWIIALVITSGFLGFRFLGLVELKVHMLWFSEILSFSPLLMIIVNTQRYKNQIIIIGRRANGTLKLLLLLLN